MEKTGCKGTLLMRKRQAFDQGSGPSLLSSSGLHPASKWHKWPEYPLGWLQKLWLDAGEERSPLAVEGWGRRCEAIWEA